MTRSQGKAPAFSKTLGGLDKMLKPSKLKLKAKAKAKVEVAGVAAAAAVEAAADEPPQDVVDAHEVEPALSPKSPQEDAVMSQEGLFERPDLFSDFAHPSQKKALKKCDERMEKSTKAVWKQQFKGDKMIAEALIETVVSDDPWNYDLHPTAKDLKQCFVNLASKCNVHILDKVYVGLVSSCSSRLVSRGHYVRSLRQTRRTSRKC